MFRVALLTALVLAVVPATAQAYWELTPDGQPKITTSSLGPVEDFELSVCPPDGSACTPAAFTPDPIRVGVYLPGETPVGTTFVIKHAASGLDERSPTWKGRMRPTAPPSISGNVATTHHVAPARATWVGGWGNETSEPYLVACTNPQATGCMYLPPAYACAVPCTTTPAKGSVVASGNGLAALPPVLGGHHLFAVEQRLPADHRGWPVAGAVLLMWSFDYRFDVNPQDSWGVTTTSAPVTIAPTAIDPPPVAAPTVTLRKRALRSKGKLSVGRITCAAASCKVALKVSGGGKKAVTTTFLAKQGVTALTTPSRRGRLTVRVHVDGKLITTGKVKA